MANSYEHSTKRQRIDDGSRDHKDEDRFNASPSPCVHVRNLSDLATDNDLVEAVSHFGRVRDVKTLSKNQALIEFDNLEGAKNCVEYCLQGNVIHCGGRSALFNYSLSKKIQRLGDGEGRPPNHILLFTILNPLYPINCEVLHTINSPYGQVQRIVIFRKNGLQSMVEFDSVEAAQRAKQALNGADIYSGCCTLKVEYAKPSKLNVVRNDSESWDYTNASLGGKESHGGRSQPLLQEPRFRSAAPSPYNGPAGTGFGGSGGGGGGGPSFGGPGGYYEDGFEGYGRSGPYGPDRFGPKGGHDRFGRGGGYDGGPGSSGAVCMVYGLNMDKMNCDRLFNLFCLYGNVLRVKFLKSKEGSAMVQLGDPVSVERAITNLSNAELFGNKLQLSVSKQAFLQEVPNPNELPDGTLSYKDFMGSRNNRFSNPEAAQKNRIQSPSKVLHFFNAPPTISENEINEIFESVIGKSPIKIKKSPSKTERSCTGLIEFESKSDGIEGLVLANHTPISTPGGKSPFIFKLCFSGMSIGS